MAEVVTRLIIAADGSLRTLGQFEQGMEQAGQATAYTSGAVADFERRIETARVAMERGNAVTTQSVQRKTAEQRAWEKWSATVDKTTALRIRLEREAATAAVAATNAVNMGYATQEQALTTLMTLEQRHAQQLAAQISLTNADAASIHNSTEALRLNTVAANQNNAVRRSGSGIGAGGQNFSSSNVAAQFQDIGVTAAMGMSPMMIALPQGTQLSAVLGGQGLTGTVRTLGAAFTSIISPVSLLTIGVVALGATGIQALMGMMNSADDATSSLERHNTWLDETLKGYEDVRAAAASVVEEAQRLPQNVAEQQLGRQLSTDMEAFAERIAAAARQQEGLNSLIEQWMVRRAEFEQRFPNDTNQLARYDAVTDQARQLAELEISAEATNAELEAVMATTDALMATASEDAIRTLAQEIYDLASSLIGARAEIGSTQAALGAFQAQANRRIEIEIGVSTDRATAAIEELRRLAPELRSAEQQAQDALREGLAAPDAIMRQAAQSEFDSTIAALAEQERRQEAARISSSSSGGGASSAAEQLNAYERATQAVNQNITALETQAQTFGLSEQAASSFTTAMDLLRAAEEAGLPITSGLIDQINGLAGAYAQAQTETQRLAEMQQSAFDVSAELTNALGGMGSGLFDAIKQGGDIAGGVLDMLIDKVGQFGSAWLDHIIDNGINAAMGMLSPGAGGLFGAGAGSAFNAPSSYVSGGFYPGLALGGTVTAPGMTWVGERGPELLSLPRGAQVTPLQMAANANRPAVQNNLHIHPPSGYEARVEETPDEQGGTRTDVRFDRMVAGAMSRPGSRSAVASRSAGRLVRR